jgi:hypothetical protein
VVVVADQVTLGYLQVLLAVLAVEVLIQGREAQHQQRHQVRAMLAAMGLQPALIQEVAVVEVLALAQLEQMQRVQRVVMVVLPIHQQLQDQQFIMQVAAVAVHI